MGISYNPILCLGRVFESEEDALDFYQKYFKLSEDQLKDIEADGFGGGCMDIQPSTLHAQVITQPIAIIF